MKFMNAGYDTLPRRRVSRLFLLGMLLSLAIGLGSCEPISDKDIADCRTGIALRFVFDYHMEPGANAFSSNVDCVNVYVFDTAGNYLTQYRETAPVLREENYRMPIPLDLGDYHLLVFGGIACDQAKFDFAPQWPDSRSGETLADVRVTLPLDEEGVSGIQLHKLAGETGPDSAPQGGLFYGTLDLHIGEEDYATDYREETVNLMKDTNNIQVILEELNSPYITDYKDFDFRIIDDNFVLNAENKVAKYLATDDFQPGYIPYASENRIMGYVEYQDRDGALNTEDEKRPVQVACAEFSTSRLFLSNVETARLVITSTVDRDSAGNPRKIIDMPLITYLAAIRGFGDNWIKDDQEFLDRQSRWTLMFFLQRNVWVKARVAVNAWTVRINDIELDY